ncbi:unnamed protein product [Symbiodinium sp. KB8]|nr:unnamed protein product [Symbiodinium sp. KB8]
MALHIKLNVQVPGEAANERWISNVRTEKQRTLLSEFSRKEQHFNEEYQKNKPLCFSAKSYQRTHPKKLSLGHKDADATLASPMILGVADGVSQLEEFGMDASQLPRELLRICEDLGMNQLIPDRQVNPQEAYQGPVSLLKEAYEETESMGSTTILLAVLDNSTKIHGKLHPMVAVLTIGDCELLMLRRLDGRQSPLQAVFHTEMQRIDGHSQTPLQLARVDDRVDPDFDEELALEVIERGSAVHCVSAYEGDIIILGSDGIFDNLFLEEIVDIVNESLPAPKAGSFVATQPSLLSLLAKRLVDEAHSKSEVGRHGLPDTPIGLGGKMDDTSVVVGEVVEWTRAHSEVWAQVRKQHQWRGLVSCGGMDNMACRSCRFGDDSGSEYELDISQEKGERGLCSTALGDGSYISELRPCSNGSDEQGAVGAKDQVLQIQLSGTFRKAQSAESAEVVVTTATDVQAESQEGCGTAKGMNILPACLPGPMMLPPGLVRVAPRAPPSDDCLAPAAATPATPAPLPWPPPAPAPSGPALPGEEGPSGASLLEVAQLYQALAGLRMELTAVADLLRAIEVAKADVQQMVSQAGLRFGDGEQAGVWPAPAPFRYVAPQVGWQVPSASWSDGVQLP